MRTKPSVAAMGDLGILIGLSLQWKPSFIIYAINMTNPVTYLIKDLNNNPIKGSFYKQELQKTTGDQELFRISKVIKKNNNKALVSWEGYGPEFNSWIPISSIKNIYLKNFRQKK